MNIKKIAALLCAVFIFNYALAYRPYSFLLSGAKNAGFAGACSASVEDADAAASNPAALVQIEKRNLFYEFDATMRIERIQFDRKLKIIFDQLAYAGFLLPVIPRQHIISGVFLSSLFMANGAGKNQFNVKQAAAIWSMPLLDNLSFGLAAGVAAGYEDRIFVFSPSFQAGFLYKPIGKLRIGLYGQAPLYFKWNTYRGGAVEELTPFQAKLGGQYRIGDVKKGKLDISAYLNLDLGYQGWDFSWYQKNGVYEYFDTGSHFFNFGQNINPHISIIIHEKHRTGGRFSLGFMTEPYYENDGSYRIMGSLTIGATAGVFKEVVVLKEVNKTAEGVETRVETEPREIIRFNGSIIDRLIPRLMGFDNVPIETIKISAIVMF